MVTSVLAHSAALGSYSLTLALVSLREPLTGTFKLHNLHGIITRMLYALRMMSTYHHTCPQLSNMTGGELRNRGEALCTRRSTVDTRVHSVPVKGLIINVGGGGAYGAYADGVAHMPCGVYAPGCP